MAKRGPVRPNPAPPTPNEAALQEKVDLLRAEVQELRAALAAREQVAQEVATRLRDPIYPMPMMNRRFLAEKLEPSKGAD